MSRSYKKFVKVGTCGGFGRDNSEFYKYRRKRTANKNKQIVRNAVANYNPEDIDDHVYAYKPSKRDDWAEPTDGTSLFDKKTAESLIGNNPYGERYDEWIRRKILPKLKKKGKRR